jgi:hypothetical protein
LTNGFIILRIFHFNKRENNSKNHDLTAIWAVYLMFFKEKRSKWLKNWLGTNFSK